MATLKPAASRVDPSQMEHGPLEDAARASWPESHALGLAGLAERSRDELAARSRVAPLPGRARRAAALARQGIVRKGRELVQEHWDLALFDVLFGCVKVFGIYPALYFAGLTWTIPIMEYAPLNTQLWTAGYLFLRRQLLSKLGARRYGVSLNELDAFKDARLGILPRDARSLHRFRHAGEQWTVRVRRSRLRAWRDRLRGVTHRNVLLQSELRDLVSDAAFRFAANELRNNPPLYEAVMIREILARHVDRERLLARLVPESELSEAADRELVQLIGETPLAVTARVVEQGNALTRALARNLGSGFSATSLCLRWINWAYQRRVWAGLRRLADQEYRLLAELVSGTRLARATGRAPVQETQRQVEIWREQAREFGDRAAAVHGRDAAHDLIEHELARARTRGLPMRLARAARRVSPAGRRWRRTQTSEPQG